MSNFDGGDEIQADSADHTRGTQSDQRSVPNLPQHVDHQKADQNGSSTGHRSEVVALSNLTDADLKSVENTQHQVDTYNVSIEERTGHRSEVVALSNLIDADLKSVKNTQHQVYTYNVSIEKLHNKFKKLKEEHGSVEEFRELKKAVRKLKQQISSGRKDEDPDSETNQSLKANITAEVDRAKADRVAHQMPNLNESLNFERSSEFKDFEARFLELKEELKLCLLCFAVFPENEKIKKKTMVYWWIGEGFVPPVETTEKDKTAEQFASEYFDQLVAKGFVEPVYRKRSGKVETCKMHPLIRSMVIRLAKRASFFDFDDGFNAKEDYTVSLRACLTGKALTKEQETKMFNKLEELHTMFNVNEPILDFDPEWLAKMKNINVLYLGRWQTEATHHIEVEDTKTLKKKDAHVLDGLENMKHLRFLSLQGVSRITDLPKAISELTNLTILDLRACHNLEVIPDEIGRLKKLTHLDMSECYLLDRMPKELSSLTELRVLSGFVLGDPKIKNSCTLDNLKLLSNLRKLSIHTGTDDFPSEDDLRALNQFGALTKLTIVWGRGSVQAKSEAEQPGTKSKRSDLQTVRAESSLSNQGAGTPSREIKEDGKANSSAERTTATSRPKRFSRLRESISFSRRAGPPPEPLLPSRLIKLDLQCFPLMIAPDWLRPGKLKNLKKLFIRGGKFGDLGQFQEFDGEEHKVNPGDLKWEVEELRLKYLTELEMNWRELQELFPKLEYLEKVDCPRLSLCPCDDSGVWMKKKRLTT